MQGGKNNRILIFFKFEIINNYYLKRKITNKKVNAI